MPLRNSASCFEHILIMDLRGDEKIVYNNHSRNTPKTQQQQQQHDEDMMSPKTRKLPRSSRKTPRKTPITRRLRKLQGDISSISTYTTDIQQRKSKGNRQVLRKRPNGTRWIMTASRGRRAAGLVCNMGAFMAHLKRLGWDSSTAREMRALKFEELRCHQEILEKQEELCRIRERLDQAYVPMSRDVFETPEEADSTVELPPRCSS